MQTGLNKEKLSITNVVDFTPFTQLLELGEKDLLNTLNTSPNKFLDNFFELFLQQNDNYNRDKKRFKDYLANIDYENPARIKDVLNPTQERNLEETVQEDVEEDINEDIAPSSRLGLSLTARSNMFTYNDNRAQTGYYENLA